MSSFAVGRSSGSQHSTRRTKLKNSAFSSPSNLVLATRDYTPGEEPRLSSFLNQISNLTS